MCPPTSTLISEESYYLQCGRYIERNPVKIGLVKLAWQYTWSSAGYYAFGQRDELITKNIYYESLGYNDEVRQAQYQEFLKIDEPYSQIVDAALIKV